MDDVMRERMEEASTPPGSTKPTPEGFNSVEYWKALAEELGEHLKCLTEVNKSLAYRLWKQSQLISEYARKGTWHPG